MTKLQSIKPPVITLVLICISLAAILTYPTSAKVIREHVLVPNYSNTESTLNERIDKLEREVMQLKLQWLERHPTYSEKIR
jgi:hypothetical protein